MLIELMNTLVSLAMLVVVIWFILAIASMRLRPLRGLRRWYSRQMMGCIKFLFWRVPVRIIKWVFRRPLSSGPAHMSNPPRIGSQRQEDDAW